MELVWCQRPTKYNPQTQIASTSYPSIPAQDRPSPRSIKPGCLCPHRGNKRCKASATCATSMIRKGPSTRKRQYKPARNNENNRVGYKQSKFASGLPVAPLKHQTITRCGTLRNQPNEQIWRPIGAIKIPKINGFRLGRGLFSYIYICIHRYRYMYIYILIYIYVHIHACTHMRTYVRTYIQI